MPREIASYADPAAVNLIAMGTHGRTGLDQRLLGSITERVLRATSVPLTTHLIYVCAYVELWTLNVYFSSG